MIHTIFQSSNTKPSSTLPLKILNIQSVILTQRISTTILFTHPAFSTFHFLFKQLYIFLLPTTIPSSPPNNYTIFSFCSFITIPSFFSYHPSSVISTSSHHFSIHQFPPYSPHHLPSTSPLRFNSSTFKFQTAKTPTLLYNNSIILHSFDIAKPLENTCYFFLICAFGMLLIFQITSKILRLSICTALILDFFFCLHISLTAIQQNRTINASCSTLH